MENLSVPVVPQSVLRAVEWVGTPTRLYGLDKYGDVVVVLSEPAAPTYSRLSRMDRAERVVGVVLFALACGVLAGVFTWAMHVVGVWK
jgi:hypothetical protein